MKNFSKSILFVSLADERMAGKTPRTRAKRQKSKMDREARPMTKVKGAETSEEEGIRITKWYPLAAADKWKLSNRRTASANDSSEFCPQTEKGRFRSVSPHWRRSMTEKCSGWRCGMTVPKHGEHSLKARINLERVGS